MDSEILNLPQIIMPGEMPLKKAVSRINKKMPGFFKDIKEIRIVPCNGAYAYVTNATESAGIIFLDYNRIKSEMSTKAGSNQEALEEAIISAVEEALSHEVGHIKADYEGGEFPAEQEARNMMNLLNTCVNFNLTIKKFCRSQ